MGQVTASISISLDGFVAGPDASLQDPLGKGGEQLHDWVLRLAGWRRRHGYEGGETGVDDDVMEEANRDTGAVVMGRGMFSGGAGLAWEDDPNPTGWWGDEPPFHVPVFVVTSHPREPLAMEGGTTFTFVTEGVERAVELAREAGDRDVLVAGGGSVIEQALQTGLLDVLQLHVVPVLLGGGARLFDGRGDGNVRLELDRTLGSEAVSHLRYRVLR